MRTITGTETVIQVKLFFGRENIRHYMSEKRDFARVIWTSDVFHEEHQNRMRQRCHEMDETAVVQESMGSSAGAAGMYGQKPLPAAVICLIWHLCCCIRDCSG